MRRAKCILVVGVLLLVSVCSALAQVNVINTVAGGGTQNNIAGVLADISTTSGVAVGPGGNVYLVSEALCQVFKLNPAGQLFLVAGDGACGYSGDGGPAANAELSYPYGLS